MKKKRIVTQIGNIFCVQLDNKRMRFFQYVAKDMTQLNSSVIRVFKRDYASDSTPEINVIVSDCIDFYAHTVLRVGIERGAWCKVGTSTDIGNPDNIMFRWFDEMDFSGITKSFNWYVWKINKPETFIGEMEESYKKYDLGMVYSYKNIVARIRTGKYLTRDID